MFKLLFALVLVGYLGSSQALTGGEAAKQGDYPFMVSIRDAHNCHICGGTIIGDRWVLTANACYSRSFYGFVTFGTTSLDNNCAELVNNSTQITIDDALYNPWAYDQAPYTHDLVLVHLSQRIPFSENVQPVQLPEYDEAWPYGQSGKILGWANSLNSEELQIDLQEAIISPLYSDDYCEDTSVWGGWYVPDTAVMKCGGDPSLSYYCGADYGGPLLVQGKQYGIISYSHSYDGTGSDCGQYPGIYSPISYFRNWIRDTTGI